MAEATPLEKPARRLHPRIRLVWLITHSLWATAITCVLASFLELKSSSDPFLRRNVALVTFGFGILLICSWAFVFLRYRRWRLELRPRDLFTSRGALFQTFSVVPFDRIQFVETRQGPLDRSFKLAQVVVYTAAGRAARIPGLANSDAEALRDELSQVAGAATV